MSNLNQFQSFAKRNKGKIVSNNKAVIYTRVSDVKQQDNTSLESQKKYCTEYAQNKNFEISGYYGGTYASAKTDDRKAFQEMLTDVRRKKISNIIVYSIDRFSRAGASAISTVEELNRKGINVISVTQPVDTESSTGTFFQNINLLFSKYDNDQRREKTITGMKQRLLNGYWMGVAPLGYKNARNEQNIPILELSDKAKLIKKAFLWKASESLTNVEIIEKLKQRGLTLYKQRLTDMFRNPVYCGLISHSLLEGEIVEGKHQGIVSKDVFLKVNGIQAKNNHNYKQNKTNENLPLKGFAKCKSCGSALTGYIVKKKNIYYYKCKTIACSCNRNTNVLHTKFEELLDTYKVDSKLLAPLKTQLQYTFEYFNESSKENEDVLKYNLKKVKEKIEKIEERYVIGEIEREMYQKFILKFREEEDSVLQELGTNGNESSNLEYYIDSSLKLFSNINEIWGLSNFKEKQKLQNILFPSGIEYDRKSDRVRTTNANSAMELIRSLSVSMGNKKSEQKVKNTYLSACVTLEGFEPSTVRAEI